eukprot:scaffold186643_cov21-Tisochrysis_lutea.AAC.2
MLLASSRTRQHALLCPEFTERLAPDHPLYSLVAPYIPRETDDLKPVPYTGWWMPAPPCAVSFTQPSAALCCSFHPGQRRPYAVGHSSNKRYNRLDEFAARAPDSEAESMGSLARYLTQCGIWSEEGCGLACALFDRGEGECGVWEQSVVCGVRCLAGALFAAGEGFNCGHKWKECGMWSEEVYGVWEQSAACGVGCLVSALCDAAEGSNCGHEWKECGMWSEGERGLACSLFVQVRESVVCGAGCGME